MIKTTDQTKALNKALLQAQKGIQAVEKDSANPHFKSRYASLTAVLQAVKDPLNEAGLLITQSVGSADGNGGLIVTTRLTHAESSEWIETSVPIPLEQHTAQKVGSASTYGRRYGLTSLLGLAEADDDGTAASKDQKRSNGYKPPPDRQGPAPKTTADLLAEITACKTVDDLEAWNCSVGQHVAQLSDDDRRRIQAAWSERDDQLSEPAA